MIPDTKSAKVIPNKVLKTVWKKVSKKPFPEINAYSLTDKAFLLAVKLLQKKNGVTDTRVEEYGVDFDNRLIDACTFEFEGHMIVFVKESAPLQDTLEHELRHVAKWKHEDTHDDKPIGKKAMRR